MRIVATVANVANVAIVGRRPPPGRGGKRGSLSTGLGGGGRMMAFGGERA